MFARQLGVTTNVREYGNEVSLVFLQVNLHNFDKKVSKSFDHEMPEEKAGTPGLENIFTFKFCS